MAQLSRRTFLTGAGALSVAAVLASCSQVGGGANGSGDLKVGDFLKASYDELSDGNALTLSIAEIPDQLSPFHADSSKYSTDLWKWYNPVLALFAPNGDWSFNDDYLTSVKDEVKDGNTVVTFTFRDDAVFNDGTPMDWRCIENTWRLNNGSLSDLSVSSTDGYERITSVVKGDSDATAVVTFDGPYAWWKGLFNYALHPAVDETNFNTAYINEPHPEWGAGPYMVSSYDLNQGVATFVPNDKWWGDPGKLTSVTMRQMEAQASLNAFRNGEIDATRVANKDRLAQVKDMPGIEIYTGVSTSVALYMLNSHAPALADPKVRHAIFAAIDRAALAKVRFQGIDYTEEPPGSLTLMPYQPDYEDNFSKAVKYSVDESNKLMEEAGYAKNGSGMYAKDGEEINIRYVIIGDDEITKAYATATLSMLKTAGIGVTLDSRPVAEFSKVYSKRDFDLFGLGFSQSDPFGVAYFGQIYGSDSGLNLSGTGTEEMDKKIAELQAIADPKKQIQRANELEVEAFQLYGVMPTFNGPEKFAVKKGLANYGAMGFGNLKPQLIGFVN